jgi:hypothetical protein
VAVASWTTCCSKAIPNELLTAVAAQHFDQQSADRQEQSLRPSAARAKNRSAYSELARRFKHCMSDRELAVEGTKRPHIKCRDKALYCKQEEHIPAVPDRRPNARGASNFPCFAAVVHSVVMKLVLLDAKVHVLVRLPCEDLLLLLPFCPSQDQRWPSHVAPENAQIKTLPILQLGRGKTLTPYLGITAPICSAVVAAATVR